MLAVTSQAASAIDDILSSREELPDEAGVRITTKVDVPEDGPPEQALSLEVVEAPEEGDEVLEGAPVFLEPEAAALLDDKLLDADLSGERVHFALKEQS
jgi:iron-sulfur cluster assembly protein